MNLEQYFSPNNWLLIVSLIWTLPWKGFALWKAAQRQQKIWFVVLLVVNTFALLEIIYIFFISKRPLKKELVRADAEKTHQ